jgi:uncharacterized protein (TIGR02246 family)
LAADISLTDGRTAPSSAAGCSIIDPSIQAEVTANMKRTLVKRLPALLLGLTTLSASAEPVDQETLASWLHRYEQAWESRDAEAASSIFTENALYYETPYAEPFRGREGIADYWARVTEDQRDVDFDAEVIAVKDDVGVAHWNAKFTNTSTGGHVELDGVFVLQFDGGNLVSELREWWVLRQ